MPRLFFFIPQQFLVISIIYIKFILYGFSVLLYRLTHRHSVHIRQSLLILFGFLFLPFLKFLFLLSHSLVDQLLLIEHLLLIELLLHHLLLLLPL